MLNSDINIENNNISNNENNDINNDYDYISMHNSINTNYKSSNEYILNERLNCCPKIPMNPLQQTVENIIFETYLKTNGYNLSKYEQIIKGIYNPRNNINIFNKQLKREFNNINPNNNNDTNIEFNNGGLIEDEFDNIVDTYEEYNQTTKLLGKSTSQDNINTNDNSNNNDITNDDDDDASISFRGLRRMTIKFWRILKMKKHRKKKRRKLMRQKKGGPQGGKPLKKKIPPDVMNRIRNRIL